MKILPPTLPEPAPRLTSPSPARIVPFGAPPPDAADEDFADGSVEMNGDGSQFRVSPALQAAQPLTSDRTVYVDSVAGSDTNAGSQAQPFQTFARAWAERQRYGVLRAKFTIRLLGVGPYTMPSRLGPSIADAGGYLIVRGDEAAEITHATGTFTGDFAGGNIGTSPGLGSDTHKCRFVKIVDGAMGGSVFQVLKHTDTLITASSKRFRSNGGSAVVAGTAFKIYVPGTQITAASTPRIEGWVGADTSGADQRHVFFDVAFSGAMGCQSAHVAFVGCSFSATLFVNSSIVTTQWVDATILGAALGIAYRSAGIVLLGGTLALNYHSFFFGVYSHASGTTALTVTNSLMEHFGGRLTGALTVVGGWYRLGKATSGDYNYRYEATLTCGDLACFPWGAAATVFEFAVTTGSCVRVLSGGQVTWASLGVAASGGTSAPTGFGVDVAEGGKCWFRVAPTLTGGTLDKDLKTSNNGGVANSVLSAAGTAAGVAADALLGEVLARVA